MLCLLISDELLRSHRQILLSVLEFEFVILDLFVIWDLRFGILPSGVAVTIKKPREFRCNNASQRCRYGRQSVFLKRVDNASRWPPVPYWTG